MSRGVLALVVFAAVAGAAGGTHAQTGPPEGNGKQLVAQSCTRCHGLDRVVNSGYTHAGWVNVVAIMVNAGAKLSPDQVKTVVDYLAANFPRRTAPVAAIVPGSVRVTIREWPLPIPGSRPHPATRRFQTWPIPSGGGVVRNVSPTADGNLAIACSGVNRVGLVEIHPP